MLVLEKNTEMFAAVWGPPLGSWQEDLKKAGPQADLQLFTNLLVLFTVRGQQHHAATQRYPHGHGAPTRLPVKLTPTLRVQDNRTFSSPT